MAGILVTGFSLLLSLTLLPACLAWLGPRLDAGGFFQHSRFTRSERAAERWRHWGNLVTSRPKTTLAVAGGALLLLASQSFRLNPAIPRGDWLPAEPESVRALHDLDRNGRSNVVQSLRIVLDLPARTPLWSREGWDAVRRLSSRLQKDPRIERIHSLPILTGGNPALVRFIPAPIRNSFVTADGKATLIEAVPAATLSPNDQVRLVRELRERGAVELTGLSGTTLRIGGLPAFNSDYESAIVGRFKPVLSLVVAATLVALFLGFRSVLVAVKAVVLNLLSVGASFGALVLVFQDGHGARLLGLDGPTAGVFPIVPVLVFCIVFGLSMDYEVILVARVAEARRAGMDEAAAIAEGLAKTGPVITSAAAIMVVVFSAFTLGGFLVIKMVGFALAVAVLLDATLVRFVIGPALLRLAGEWNWWPRRLATAG
jgi:RND superfamily putative drug exporter